MIQARRLQLEKLRQERLRWRKRQAEAVTEHAQSLTDSDVAELARMRDEQHDLLLRAVALRVASKQHHFAVLI